jgi:hypothetical protein
LIACSGGRVVVEPWWASFGNNNLRDVSDQKMKWQFRIWGSCKLKPYAY